MRSRFGPRGSPVRNRYAVPIKPMIVDLKHDRRTVPTPSGKQYPVFCGPGATSMLMYIALNPAAKGPEICAALEITRASFQSRVQRLQDMNVVIGRWRYQINLALAHQTELVRFLCQQGLSNGMTRNTNARVLRNPDRRNKPLDAFLPPDLFGTKNRTRILLMVAALHETYSFELHHVLGIDLTSLPIRLREFVTEGILHVRIVKRVKCYSLNPEVAGAQWLRSLLRRWGMKRPDIVAAANGALLRRLEVERTGKRRERDIFAELRRAGLAAGDIIYGVQRERPPLATWRRLHGLYNSWRFSRQRRIVRNGATITVLRRDRR